MPSPPPSNSNSKPHFSLFTQTIANVASFLAPPPSSSSSSSSSPPPPPSPSPDDDDDDDVSTSSSYGGIKNDLAEISGSFKSLLSSSNKAVVTGISKFASNLLQFHDDDDLEDDDVVVVGITDDVVDFVQQISLRPECWIDFPLSLNHQDFNISDSQKDHAAAIEELVPSLTTLRHKIQSYMSEQQFWVIYFIFLLPRLNEDHYKLLSTPEIVQVREVLLQKLRNKKNTPTEFSEPENPENRSPSEKGCQVDSTERVKSSGETSANRMKPENKENCKVSDEDDVPFSDLEDEDNNLSGRLPGIRKIQSSNFSSASESGEWVRLSGTERKARSRERRSESEGSSDWLNVEDVDL